MFSLLFGGNIEFCTKNSIKQKVYFTVKHKGKFYCVDYLSSDGQILGLINRDTWEITDEEYEELNIYLLNDTPKRERKQIKNNIKFANKLITFCIRHFNDYEPKIRNI